MQTETLTIQNLVATACTKRYDIHPLRPSGLYMNRQVQEPTILYCAHKVHVVFCTDLRINSDYFLIQH